MALSPRLSPPELIACRVVHEVMESLPLPIRQEAACCAIELSLQSDDNDLLGLFEGNSLLDPSPQSVGEFPRITLFLAALWDSAEGEAAEFREEVKTTLLHELGHFLGLDEEAVEALGLG